MLVIRNQIIIIKEANLVTQLHLHSQVIEVHEEDDKFLRLLQLLGLWYDRGSILIFVDKQEKCDQLFMDLMKDFKEGNQNYSAIEFTSMYTGQVKQQNVKHAWVTTNFKGIAVTNVVDQQTGGFVEMQGSFGASPLTGLAPDTQSASEYVVMPASPVGLVGSASISSYAAESTFTSNSGWSVAINYPYWSPVTPSASSMIPEATTWIGDG